MESIGHLPLNALLKVLLIVTGPVLNCRYRGSAGILLLHAELRYLIVADAMLGLVINRRRFISQIIHRELIL